jgi:hypothetical protein
MRNNRQVRSPSKGRPQRAIGYRRARTSSRAADLLTASQEPRAPRQPSLLGPAAFSPAARMPGTGVHHGAMLCRSAPPWAEASHCGARSSSLERAAVDLTPHLLRRDAPRPSAGSDPVTASATVTSTLVGRFIVPVRLPGPVQGLSGRCRKVRSKPGCRSTLASLARTTTIPSVGLGLARSLRSRGSFLRSLRERCCSYEKDGLRALGDLLPRAVVPPGGQSIRALRFALGA